MEKAFETKDLKKKRDQSRGRTLNFINTKNKDEYSSPVNNHFTFFELRIRGKVLI